MSVSLSIKHVPDDLAERLRARAARNRRSLQREMLSILEQAVPTREWPVDRTSPTLAARLSIDELAERASRLFPSGTPSSTGLVREMRDGRYGGHGAGAGRHRAPKAR